MIHSLSVSSILLYALCAVAFLIGVISRQQRGPLWLLRTFQLAFLLHSLALVFLIRFEGNFLFESDADYLMWLAWLLALAFVLFSKRFNFPVFGAFISSIICLFFASSGYLVHQSLTQKPESAGIFFIMVHIVPALIAEASLVLACMVSLLFLVRERQLKRKAGTAIFVGAPGLTTLDQFNRNLVVAGFGAMTISVISGSLWAVNQSRPLLSADPVQWIAFVSWTLLGLMLQLRLSGKWSARRISALTALVAAGLLISLFTLRFMNGSVWHGQSSGRVDHLSRQGTHARFRG